jgi:DNA repair exonuclease SbcCD ATPase subunit
MVLICTTVLGLAACASQIGRKQETAQSARDVSSDINATQSQIDTTLASLDNLMAVQPAQLEPAYRRYAADVDKMKLQAGRVNRDADELRKDSQSYLANWEASHSKIQNDELRATSEARRQQVMNRFTALRTSYDHTRTSLDAFIRNLEDVRTALNTDLTKRGVQAVAQTDVVQNAHSNADDVKQSLAQVSSDSTALANALAPNAPVSSSNERTPTQQ